jgi:CBS domain-containing protein
MKIKDVMTTNPITISVDGTVSEASALLRKNRIGGLPVMDGDHLAGIVTETDLLSLLNPGDISDDLWLPSPLEVVEVPIREFINWEKTKRALSNIGHSKISEVMTKDVITISEDADIEEAAAIMLNEGIDRLPVVRGDRLVGIITREDIIWGIGSAYTASVDESEAK